MPGIPGLSAVLGLRFRPARPFEAFERMLKTRITEWLSGRNLAPLPIELPEAVFAGVIAIPPGSSAEPAAAERRKPVMAPEGTTNLARGKTVTASDDEPLIGDLKMLVDGGFTTGSPAALHLLFMSGMIPPECW